MQLRSIAAGYSVIETSIMEQWKRYLMFAIVGFAAVATVSSWAKPPTTVPEDTLTDFNVASTDSPADVAILRGMQRTQHPDGTPVRRPPAIRITVIVPLDETEQPLKLASQHVRLRPGKYGIAYLCSKKDKWISGKTTQTFAAGRRYYMYCESRNWSHLELKVTEAP
jgi:hypothetical protein